MINVILLQPCQLLSIWHRIPLIEHFVQCLLCLFLGQRRLSRANQLVHYARVVLVIAAVSLVFRLFSGLLRVLGEHLLDERLVTDALMVLLDQIKLVQELLVVVISECIFTLLGNHNRHGHNADWRSFRTSILLRHHVGVENIAVRHGLLLLSFLQCVLLVNLGSHSLNSLFLLGESLLFRLKRLSRCGRALPSLHWLDLRGLHRLSSQRDRVINATQDVLGLGRRSMSPFDRDLLPLFGWLVLMLGSSLLLLELDRLD